MNNSEPSMLHQPPPISTQDREHRTHKDALNAASDQLVTRRTQLKRATERLHRDTLELRQVFRSVQAVSSPGRGNPIRKVSVRALRPREIEVLRLIAEGYSTKQIAAELGISFKTAACYRSRLLQKFHVHETASLVRLAIRTGLIAA